MTSGERSLFTARTIRYPGLMNARFAALLASLVGCAPGTLSTPAGDEPMRTATYILQTQGAAQAIGVDRAVLLLSNGLIPCDPIPLDSDWAAAEVDLFTAIGREGARHAYLELYKSRTSTWVGRYPGGIEAPIAEVAAGLGVVRATDGYAFAIDEAIVTEEDGLYQTFEPTRVSGGEFDDEAWVEVDRFDPEDGTSPVRIDFSIPTAGIGGSVRHLTQCEPDSYAFQVLADCSVEQMEAAVANAEDGADAASLLESCGG